MPKNSTNKRSKKTTKKSTSSSKTNKKPSKNKTQLKDTSTSYAFLTTFFSIIGFILAILLWKDDDYVMFYAKQSLIVFIAAVAVNVINWFLVFIPVLGWLIMVVLNILLIVLWFQSWIYALSGEKRKISILGQFTDKIVL